MRSWLLFFCFQLVTGDNLAETTPDYASLIRNLVMKMANLEHELHDLKKASTIANEEQQIDTLPRGSGVELFQTTTELFSVGARQSVGSLAFSLSSQQLYVRVTNGFREVRLEAFQPIVKARTSVVRPQNGSNKDHLSRFVPPPPVHFPVQSSYTHSLTRDNQPLLPAENVSLAEELLTLNFSITDQDHVLHLIALNKPMSGNMHGIRGADLECYKQARRAGFVTTFRALLSSPEQRVNNLVHYEDRNTPVVNLRGEVLAESWLKLFISAKPDNASFLTFDGRDVLDEDAWPTKEIWLGSTSDDLRTEMFCETWRRSGEHDQGAAVIFADGRWLFGDPQLASCNLPLITLCIENMSKFNVDKKLGRRRLHAP